MTRSLPAALLLIASLTPALAAAQLEVAGEFATPPPSPPAQPVLQAEPPPRFEGSVALGGWFGVFDLSDAALTLRDPEVRAVRGVVLDRQWDGHRVLDDVVLGGFSFGWGVRGEYLRGPELRFSLGGGEVDGPWTAAPGAPEGMDLRITSVLAVRAELAIGLQAPLGPVTPYLVGRAGVGAAIVDVAVRDARLGELGSESTDALMLELGIETGLGIELGEGLELGLAVRASFLGVPSAGGFLTIGYHAP